ncbi:MAG: hypothetical protein QOK19_1378, partial [Solirubrobacteraceae bacterium]|nr:hypothetical protein [Solirubrobacteraceae bacterium]
MSPRRSTRLLAKQSDARLVELCRQGDERAFEAIVLRYRRELLSHCRRLGLCKARSEDALQQALLKAWLALRGGTDVRELHAWLQRITHNTALNLLRSSRESSAAELDSALVDAAHVTDAALERTTALRDALSSVAALPAMQREALQLSAIQGRSHQEVASALGISHVAVRGLLYRARVTLRAGAAAVIPAPLAGWVTQSANRLSGAGSGIADSADGGFSFGGALLGSAAVAATAAVAVTSVLAPSPTARHRPDPAPRSVASAAGPSSLAADGTSAIRSGPAQGAARLRGPQRLTSSVAGGHRIVATATPLRRPTRGTEAPASSTAPAAAQQQGPPDATASNAAGSGTASPGSP